MIFADVTALEDSTPSTNDNQNIANVSLLKDGTETTDYGTFELNQFILDGNKKIISSDTSDIAFMSEDMSGDDCLFEQNPTVVFTFTQNHTSAGITLDFGFDYPAKIKVTWYSIKNEKIIS